MKKLKIKSRYNYLKPRVDKISLILNFIIIGFFLGGSHNLSLNFIVFIFLVFNIIYFYRYIEFIIPVFFLISYILSSLFFSYFLPNYSLPLIGNISYVGDQKIFTTSKSLWFNEQLLVTDNLQLNSTTSLYFCEEYEVSYTNNYVVNQGISREIKCLSKWENRDENSFFTNLNKQLLSSFTSFNRDRKEFLSGITLGAKPSKELAQIFREVGLSHILVISGFNVTLILTVLSFFIKKFPKIVKIILCIVFIFLFVMVVGPTPPILRAAFMGILGYLASMKWKNVSYIRLLFFSAIIMVIIDPYTIYSVSFHLSFLATLGIILFCEKIAFLFSSLPGIISETLSQTFAASMLTIPYSANIFNTISPVFIFSNLLVLPILPFLTIISYVYIFIKIEFIANIMIFLTDINLQMAFYLSSFKNSFIILSETETFWINFFALIIFILAAIIWILINNFRFNRIEKKRIIEYHSGNIY